LSETGYRCQAEANAENARIADWSVCMTTAYRDWGFGLCFLRLRNVKGLGWNHRGIYRIYRELELNPRSTVVHFVVESASHRNSLCQNRQGVTRGV